jgi:hypothetical protein
MLKEFATLTAEETAMMMDAVPHIIILVAAADDDMDEMELAAAQKLADVRSYSNSQRLSAYYENIDDELRQRTLELYAHLPKVLSDREALLTERLTALNDVIAKLPSPFNYLYAKSFRSFARHVAEAHGGFLRFFTIGPKEARVVDLPMITQYPKPEDHEGLI